MINTPHAAFHWPDHIIRKRESRRIRDAHNALFNSHHKLAEFARKTVEWLDRVAAQSEAQEKANRGRFGSLADACKNDAANYREIAKKGRDALAEAEGQT